MGSFCTRLGIAVILLLHVISFAAAGTLDDYYLQQFGETKSIQLQKSLLLVSPELDSARCGMPLKHDLSRDWALLLQSTQKVLAKQLAAPALSGTELTFTSTGGHFKVHYTTSGTDAPPLADLNSNGIPDWVETVAATFENVYASYSTLGYQPAPTRPAGAPYDIYLLDLAPQGFYGVTNSDISASSASYPNAVTSWMELDNNFTDLIFKPNIYSPLQSLQITAAHEYHHAIQYGYTYYFDVWYAEATSTWMEDELYDGVDQNYTYIPAWFTNSATPLDLAVGSDAVSSGAGYGRWIFNRYLSEQHGPGMIRSAWEKVGGLASPGNNADIPMAPVLDSVLSSAAYTSSLGNDFFGFAKRVYTRNWTTHTSETAKIHSYSPRASYSTPLVDINSSPSPAITLPHYSFAYYKLVPVVGSPGNLSITITGTSGIKATAFRTSGATTVEFPFTQVNGTTVTIPGFDTSAEVVLLISNVTSTDNHSANFSTNGTGVSVTEPSGGTVYPPIPAVITSSSGGSSGCFIATAAYGSYLEPHVQKLRTFRDTYLLTNAPGRAFVALYYRCSPPLADLIARHTVLRGIAQLMLSPLVVAIVHPLLSAVSLVLLTGTLLSVRRRRISRILAQTPHATSSPI